jgi:protease-4
MHKTALLVVAALALFASRAARAQSRPLPIGEPPTPGVRNPTIGIAGDADASSVEKDPAALGFLPAWSGNYLHTELDHDGTVGVGGDGFFFASPIPYLSQLALGAGVQLLRPPSAFPFKNEEKFTLALAIRPLPGLSLGLSYAHLWADQGPVAGGIDTLDLAISARPLRWLAAALVVHDVPGPAVQQFPLQRVWDPEVAVRPFGTSLVEIAAGARFGERRQDVDPHFRLWLVPYHGLTVKADVEWKRFVDLDSPTPQNDVRVALGIALDLEHIGVQGFGQFGTTSGATTGQGWTLAARVSGDRYPSLWDGPRHLEKIDLSHGLGERKLAQVVAHLRRIERERDVAGVVVVIGDIEGAYATAEELHAALLHLRHAKKHAFAYMAETTTKGYYVATAAERIYQDPAGGIRLIGMSSTLTFLKGFGDKIGVKADFVKIAEYKSAPEQFTRTGSTEPARAQREALLSDFYNNIVSGIAAARHVDSAAVKRWIDNGPYTAKEALTAGLVDELRHGDEVEDAIAEHVGHHLSLHTPPTTPERGNDWQPPAIAVLFVDGDIIDGKSAYVPLLDMRFVGMQTLVPALAKARDNPQVKAIVLRIDSPGGSALASDIIARELERAAEVKPLICSLGDTAASGGYFIAAPCQKIFAAPSTLTGSIGIFTGKFDISGLAGKLGVSFEQFERGTHAGMDSLWREYTDDERKLILDKLRYYYGRFVDQVARGRHMTPEQVDAIGRGHVWSGVAARDKGLVDEFGGLMEAVLEAKKRAHLSEKAPVLLQALPDETTLLSQLLGLLGINLQARASAELQVLAPLIAPALRGLPGSLLLEPSVPQTRLEGDLRVE